VYENLSPIRQRRLHRRVASALQAIHPDQVEALARHYHLGQKWPDAVHYALQAGARAQEVYANQQALEHYRHAEAWLGKGLVAWPADVVTRWLADLAERRGRVQTLIGDYGEAEEAFSTAQRGWESLGDWRGSARVLNRLSFSSFVQNDCERASEYARKALAVLREKVQRAPYGTAEEEPQEEAPARKPAESLADLQATSLTYLGLCAWTQGLYDDALPYLEEALDLFEECGTDLHGLARCLNSLGQVHLDRGDLDLASDCFARSLALRQQIGDRRGEAWCWYNQGRTELARGDVALAREKLESAQTLFTEIQHPHGLEIVAHWLVQAEQAEASGQPDGRATARLPRADAPLGRPLADDEFVDVVWTAEAAEDEEIRGKTARRRHRILRLLSEAQAQGAAPRDRDLAATLGVSLTTIRRDMAALRAEGHRTPTRWRKMTTRSGE
jgi:tetratricopeptide (TPR) repeat protein